MFNKETIDALKNCPVSQLNKVRRMLTQEINTMLDILDSLTERQKSIVDLSSFIDSPMTKEEYIEKYLKKPSLKDLCDIKMKAPESNSVVDHNKQIAETTTKMFKDNIEPEFVKTLCLPTWLKSMILTPSDHSRRAESILTNMFYKHVMDHKYLKGRARSFVHLSHHSGYIRYICKVDDVTYSSDFKVFESHNIISYITLADRIFKAIQSDIAERNVSSKNYTAFINSLDEATRESFCIVARNESFHIDFVFQGETYASIERNIDSMTKSKKKDELTPEELTNKSVNYLKNHVEPEFTDKHNLNIRLNDYFCKILEPEFKRVLDLPVWMKNYIEDYPESIILENIKQDFVKYVKECTGQSINAIGIKGDWMSYEIIINDIHIRRSFRLFDLCLEPEKVTRKAIFNDIVSKVQSYIDEHRITDLTSLSNIKVTSSIQGVNVTINHSLLDVHFMYHGEKVIGLVDALRPYTQPNCVSLEEIMNSVSERKSKATKKVTKKVTKPTTKKKKK